MSDMEWVEESDWSKIRVGDRVKLLISDDCYEFTVGFQDRSLLRPVGNQSILFYKRPKSTLFVERPVVELPTEHGFYFDDDEILWEYSIAYGWQFLCGGTRFHKQDPPRVSGLRRLRPVDEVRKETAKEIFARLNDFAMRNTSPLGGRDWTIVQFVQDGFGRVAREFGVTDE